MTGTQGGYIGLLVKETRSLRGGYVVHLLLSRCFVFLMKLLRAFGPKESNMWVGVTLVALTVLLFAGALKMAMLDLLASDLVRDNSNRVKERDRRKYKKGDFILHTYDERRKTANRTVMHAQEFELRYEATTEPVTDETLSTEGFEIYQQSGKIWAQQLSHADISVHFPASQFLANDGTKVSVRPGEWIAMPFPLGGELFRLSTLEFAAYKRDLVALTSRGNMQVPSQEETLSQWKHKLRKDAGIFRKTVKVHAKIAGERGVIKTFVDNVEESRKPYNADDFIVCGDSGERYSMSALDFAASYDRSRPELATDAYLTASGFQLYSPTNKIWALELSSIQVAAHFPFGFLTRWGGMAKVREGDYLVMPFPSADEVYVIRSDVFQSSYDSHTLRDYIPTTTEALMHWGKALRRSGRVYCHSAKVVAKIALEAGEIKKRDIRQISSLRYVPDDDAMQDIEGQDIEISIGTDASTTDEPTTEAGAGNNEETLRAFRTAVGWQFLEKELFGADQPPEQATPLNGNLDEIARQLAVQAGCESSKVDELASALRHLALNCAQQQSKFDW